MTEAHLITGGTGFVGSSLILELLRKTEAHVVAVVRPGGGDAQRRLVDALLQAADAYDFPGDLREQVATRCTAVAGDIIVPGCGVQELPKYDYVQFWHSAASLRFEDRYADEIRAINIGGTHNALDLAQRAGIGAFNHVSTAYVVGSQEGLALEASIAAERPNNQYEASKLRAEQLVATARCGVRILRPSVVIGHSRTLGATNFTGMYGFLRMLYAFEGIMARTQRGFVQSRSMRLLGDPGAPLDLVPVDHVAADAVDVALSTEAVPGEPRFYHLTNPLGLQVGEVVDLMFDAIGMARPQWVDHAGDLDWIDEKFNRRIDFYRSYLRGQKVFDRRATDSVVDFDPGERRIDVERIQRHQAWYLRRLRSERVSLPVTR